MLNPDLELASSYFTTRLLAARQASQLPASAQFDLARTPLSDDELEEVVDKFRDTPRRRSGWGISEMLNEVISSQPKTLPVKDLQALQTNLIAQGYAAPDQEATGQWDPSWYASLRRFDRDNYEKQRQGYHWYSAPVMSGVNALTNTLPSRVFQGLVGAAKGLIEQTPETAERLGVVGSAAVGAGIGSLIAPGLGTAVGGAIGAGVGALSEAFFDDEEGEDESGIGAFLEVLAPWGEYQKPQELWEDLGYVLTAASFASAGGVAAKGISGSLGAIRAARAGSAGVPAVGRATVGSAIAGEAPVVGAQAPMSLGRALMAPSGSTELGVFGTIGRAASKHVLRGSPASFVEKANKLSPIAMMNRNGPKIALEAFAGASQAQLGARLFGGIGQGSKQKFLEAESALKAELGRDLTEEERDELSKKTATSTIEKSIANAPLPRSGINVPLLGDAVDIAAFALYPKRLLPFGGGRGIAKSAEALMGDTALGPFIHAQIHGRKVGAHAGRNEVRELVEKNPGLVPYMRLDYGIEVEAGRLVDAALGGRGRPSAVAEAWRNARASVVQKLHELPEEEGRSLAEELMRYSEIDETGFTAHLVGITSQERGASRFEDFLNATRKALKIEKEVGENTRYVRDEAGEIINARADIPVEPRFETFQTPEGPVKQRITSEEVSIGGVPRSTRSIDIISVEQGIGRMERQIQRYDSVVRRTSIPANASMANTRKQLAEAQLKSLKQTLKDLKRGGPEIQVDRFRITPATKDYMTRQMARARKAEYEKAREELLAAGKDEANPMRLEVAKKNHDNLVEDLLRDGIIDEVTAAKTRNLTPRDVIGKQIDEFARGAAADVELPQHMLDELDQLGYKPVTAGDDILSADEIHRFVNLDKYEVGDYTRRAAIWETLAFSPKFRSEKSLFKLRRQSELIELEGALEKNGIRLTGQQAFKRLQDYMERVNHDGSVLGPSILSKTGRPRLYKVDPRDLNVDDVYRAFEDVVGFTDETARDVYAALRRGAAYGHELKLMHPVHSAYALGQLLRINGLPGFSDLVRTWHLQVPTSFNRAAWRQGTVRYKPKAAADKAYDLAHSPQRARFERAARDTATNNNIPEQQRDVAMMLMDSVAETQVRQGRFKTVDEFYEHVDAAFAERYTSTEALNQPLFQKLDDREMRDLFEAFEEGNFDWYTRSHNTLRGIIPVGSKTRLPLNDAVEVDDFDLFNMILAATSPRTPVADNMAQAIEVFKEFKRGDVQWGQISGVMESKHKMLDDIARGHFIDDWEGPFKLAAHQAPFTRSWGGHGRFNVESYPINKLGPSKLDDSAAIQIRKRGKDGGTGVRSKEELDQLKMSIGSEGITEPILAEVRNGKIAIIDGTHRLMLAKELGLKNVPIDFNTSGLKLAEETHGFLKKARPSALNELVPADTRERMKVWNFYQNLQNRLEFVTVDTWMADLYGFDEVTPKIYDEIAADIKRIASDMSEATGRTIHPAEAQAALWVGAKHLAVAQGAPRNLLKADSFAELAEPLKAVFKGQNRAELEQRVMGEVRGLTAWGEDGLNVMRFFRDADFSTLVHENAHLLRRLMAPEDVRRIEKAMGVTSRPAGYSSTGRVVSAPEATKIAERGSNVLSRLRTGNRTRIGAMSEDRVKKLFDAVNGDEWGGMTLNAKTGEPMEAAEGFAAGIVPNEKTVTLSLEEAADMDTFRAAAKRAQKKFARDLGFEDVGLGVFRDPEKGTVTFEPSLYMRSRDDAEAVVSHLKAEGGAYDFSTGDGVFPISTDEVMQGGWTRGDEERFAEIAERYVKGKADSDEKALMGPVREALRTVWGNMRHQAVDSNFIPRGMRRELDRLFPIPESFAPPSLAKSAARGTLNRQTAGGALIGGIAGAYEGREDGILDEDILAGAAFGAAGGLLARKAGKRNYGYLPDSLMRLNTALRYSLSFTFDLGRLTEQNMIAMAKHNLPPMTSPVRHVKGKSWKSPYRNGEVTGQAAWDDAVRFFDEIQGTNIYASIDDMDRRLFQRGMLGFSPRNWEAAQAFQLYQRGWSSEKIVEEVSKIGRYGLGRTAAEKSANFIVFPFSFSKKFLTTLGDFFVQAPGRNLLLHEGTRRFYESEANDKLNEFMDRRLPFLEELLSVNSLAFGISPGRFFLQGLSDHRSAAGTAAQAISSFFVPSGAATSLAQAAGNSADLAVNAFVPLVITGESINKAGGIENTWDVLRRYVPFIREVDQYFVGAGQMGGGAFSRQAKALMESGDPYWQFTRYQEGLKFAKAELEPIATALGYSSVDGLLQSDQGAAFGAAVDAQKEQLRQELPTGFRMSQTFENQDALNAAGMMDLVNKPNRSEAEDNIIRLTEQLSSWTQAVSMLNLDADLLASLQASQIRGKAMQHADDPRFVELWNRFYLRDYGPIRRNV